MADPTTQFPRPEQPAQTLIARFHTCKAALEHMPPGSAIVNFTQGLAQLVIERGVRVNADAPGPVWTPLMPVEQVKSFGAQAPIGRAAQPVELAPAYVFLASGEAGYVAGETLAVTGGKPLA